MNYHLEPNWQLISELPDSVPDSIKTWLTSGVSLTQQLQALGEFGVQPVHERWDKGLASECQLLGVGAEDKLWQRDTILTVNNNPFVVAHTLIPTATMENIPGLKNLGNRSLGDLIFRELNGTRARLEFACLQPQDFLFTLAETFSNLSANQWWARRSILAVQEHQLLVNEVFLIKYP